MSLKKFSVGTLQSKKLSTYKFSSNRLSLRRFPFPSGPAAPAAIYVEEVFSTYLYSGTGNPIQIQNSIELGDLSTNSGSAYFPTGDGDYLKINTGEPLDFGSNNFTIEFWVYPMQFGDAMVFLSSKGDGTQTGDVDIRCNYIAEAGTTVYVQAGGSGIMSASYNGDILNKWSHVAVVRNGSTVRVYFNGVFNVSATGGTQGTTNLTAVNIGGGSGLPVAGYETVTGYMAGLRVVKGTAVYTANFTPPTAPLTAISGTSLLLLQGTSPFTDASTNAYSVVTNGSVSSSTFGPFTTPGSGKGGMVWIKARSASADHAIYDTVRGATLDLVTNSTAAQTTQTTGLNVFNQDGFNIGSLSKLNTLNALYASWTFRRQAKFFDVVTYTGNGTARTISHNLGSVPGCIIVKRTDSSTSGNWYTYHRSIGNGFQLFLNLTNGSDNSSNWNATTPTSTVFSVGGGSADTNVNGGTYVAYLFAHDAGGFGDFGTDNIISCGSYVGNGSLVAGPTVTLGYEPQWIILKNGTTGGITGSWFMFDAVRGVVPTATSAQAFALQANETSGEQSQQYLVFDSTGFSIKSNQGTVNASGDTYIYITIRRGPMKVPTSANTVFQPVVYTGTNVDNRLVPTGILTDMILARQRSSATVDGFVLGDRKRGNQYFLTGAASAQVNDSDSLMTPTFIAGTGYGNSFSAMNGFGVGNDATSQLNQSTVTSNQVVEAFARAPGFLDIVTYTGTGVARTISHNLGAVPKMMWIKNVSTASRNTEVYFYDLGPNGTLLLTTGGDAVRGSSEFSVFNGTDPTSSVFTVGTGTSTNQSGDNLVAYLMGDVPGVSKVSYYIGKGVGNVNQIDCGFTTGARFVLIKNINRTGTNGNWYVYDAARGIVSGNDPFLWINGNAAAEDTSTDYIDTYAAGFELSATAPVALNDGYGDDWIAQNITGGTATVWDVIYENGYFVAGVSNGNVHYSANGYVWATSTGVNSGSAVRALAYGDGKYIAVGTSGNLSTSSNLTTWTPQTSNVTASLLSTTYAFGKFWVGGSGGTVISSNDGVSWSNVSIGTSSAVNSVKLLNNNLVFVGAGGFIITSSDGVNFTTRTSGVATDLNSSEYNNGIYVVVGDSGVILTSTDLSTWTSRSSGALAGNAINDIVWALNRFIAVASGGETGQSDDGITWSTGSGAGADNLVSVTYGNDIVMAGNVNGNVQLSNPRYIFWAIA